MPAADPDPQLVAFGRAVRRQRVRQQRSVRELARAVGVTEQRLVRIEAGRCDVRYEQLLDLARSLDLTPAELVRDI
ncbi:MAG: helix-turn-helix transcriptional regulator [Solirubrobacteraceae bacterium]